MRLLNSFLPAVCIVFIGATSALAQNPDERRTEEQYETYHKHYDRHHGHNHAYPDRGAIFRDAPRGAILVNYAGVSYRFADGVWFEPRGPAFIVVNPPIGLVVSTLPAFATRIDRGNESYLYTNDIYYRSRPDLGGYEVVNDPEDGPVPAAASTPTAPAAAPVSNPPVPDSTSPAAPLSATLTAASAGSALPITAAQVTAPAALPIPVAQPAPAALPMPAVQPVPAAPPTPASQPVTAAQAIAPAALPIPVAQPAPAALPTPAPQPVLAAQIAPPPSSVAAIPAPVAVPAAFPATAAALPATSSQAQSPAASRGTRVITYPKNGQTPEVQARDHYECYRFAVAQTGFDPMRSTGAAAANSAEQADYERAQAACFEGRGYTIR